MQTIEMHSLFVNLSIAAYGVLAASLLIEWIGRSGGLSRKLPQSLLNIWDVLSRMERRIFCVPVRMIISLMGFSFLIIVGALGASIVYGPDVDPVVSVIHRLLLK